MTTSGSNSSGPAMNLRLKKTSSMLMLACPESIRIGFDPGGLFFTSRAAPGHVKPLLGHSSGDVEPLGAQKPNSTGVHSSALVRLVELEYEPPGHSRPAAAPFSLTFSQSPRRTECTYSCPCHSQRSLVSSSGTPWLSVPRVASSARRRKEQAATCPAGSRNQRRTDRHRLGSTDADIYWSCPACHLGRPLGIGR
eukprot:scaffold54234_cov60-Phaeocystis_antarctica.AAC.1